MSSQKSDRRAHIYTHRKLELADTHDDYCNAAQREMLQTVYMHNFHRRDLWDAIQSGAYPEYELGLQLLAEEDVSKVQFDILNPTKIWPEDVVPVQRVGKMTLNRNPDNFFVETEQVGLPRRPSRVGARCQRRPPCCRDGSSPIWIRS